MLQKVGIASSLLEHKNTNISNVSSYYSSKETGSPIKKITFNVTEISIINNNLQIHTVCDTFN